MHSESISHSTSELEAFSSSYFEEKGINPTEYLEASKVADASAVEEGPYKEKGLEDWEKRALRAYRQYELEANLETLNEKSVEERMISIREALFQDIETQYGQPPESVRQISVSNSIMLYPNAKLVGEVLYPGYVRLIDDLYDVVLDLPEGPERGSAATRLAAVTYCLGILMHPYPDGNGQTFRLLAESYLHELSDQFNDTYFKAKLSEEDVSILSLVEEEKFAAKLKREEEEYREFKTIEKVKTILAGNQLGVSVTGFRCLAILREINPNIRSIGQAQTYIMERGLYLESKMETNFIFARDTLEQRLKALASIEGSVHYVTRDVAAPSGAAPRLSPYKEKHVQAYKDLVEYFVGIGKEDIAINLTMENALNYLRQALREIEEAMERDLKMEVLQKELEEFLKGALGEDNASFIMDFVLPHKVASFDTADKRLQEIIYSGFVIDTLPRSRGRFMESSAEHFEKAHIVSNRLKEAGLI